MVPLDVAMKVEPTGPLGQELFWLKFETFDELELAQQALAASRIGSVLMRKQMEELLRDHRIITNSSEIGDLVEGLNRLTTTTEQVESIRLETIKTLRPYAPSEGMPGAEHS